MANLWFTADLHLGHARLLTIGNPTRTYRTEHRPFATVEEMDAALIANWRAVVQPKDQVWILGDIALCRRQMLPVYLEQLTGHKHLVWGNHDKMLRSDKALHKYFESTHDLTTVKVQDKDAHGGVQRIVVCHFPLRTWEASHYSAWHLYGHSHGTGQPWGRSFDVGVDAWIDDDGTKPYRPIEYSEIKNRMKWREFKQIDHHEEKASGIHVT